MKAVNELNNVREFIEKTKNFSSGERALIAHCLISSLDARQEEGVDQAWGELAERRFEEIVSGKVAPVSWSDIKKQVKASE
ncbi:MAG: addiction module protein [Desulfobulbaceae bacterium]|nr:addiction module protein [Desulfobulbaceae bacterium]